MTDFCELIVTGPDANALTQELLDRRLVASGHLSEVRSLYRWADNIHDVPEARVALRTRTELVDEIAAVVRARRPYQVPGIYALPIIASTVDYLAWIAENTTTPE